MKTKVKRIISNNGRMPHFNNKLAYTKDAINKRCHWLQKKTKTTIKHTRDFSVNPAHTKGNIENLIGMAQVPIGIAGPLLVNGEHAHGEFFIPMATTEGAMITSYNAGMRVITKSGGLNASVLSNSVHVSPVFFVQGMHEAKTLIEWIQQHFTNIKAAAEKTTTHGKLLVIEPKIMGRRLIVKFRYDSKDAQGMNMITKATNAACRYISAHTKKKYYFSSKFSSIKTVAPSNIHLGYGREVFVDGVVRRSELRLLRTTPEELYEYFSSCLLVSTHAGIIGMTAHMANAIAAIYVACGQDMADISNSHIGISMCEVTAEKDLYISLYIPNLLVGTVGGGTGLDTQRECLEIMGCYGTNKADKFAEIIAATCLAGELSISASVVAGMFISAHEKLGRNKPK